VRSLGCDGGYECSVMAYSKENSLVKDSDYNGKCGGEEDQSLGLRLKDYHRLAPTSVDSLKRHLIR